MDRYSVTKGTAKVYRIVMEERSGWGDFTIESYYNGGSLKVISDFGDYSCIWTNIGVTKTFEEFLGYLNFVFFL